ncbi:hypothetical protein Q9L58_008099 [Maublancomyces gigas]|uniref:alpha-amylase n=1 Tax=Discina gigas TaxID=1032678 RepID=A0ABR3GAP2_9PEZI
MFPRAVFFLAVLSALHAHAATPAQWRSRSIYQVLTDRFARSDGSTSAPCDTADRVYCGGTYEGIIDQLDYIQGMGFTAIWISPIVQNIAGTPSSGEAYHGYWAQDLYRLNPHFGSSSSLKALSAALHARNMYLMLDVAPNHFAHAGHGATTDFSRFVPFDSASYFHPFCWIRDYTNQTEVEECWLGDNTVALADVNTSLESVRHTYSAWIAGVVAEYEIDGLRVDTAKHVDAEFWTAFLAAAGVFSLGEVLDGNATYTCRYQGVLDSVLNYPVYYTLVRGFSGSGSLVELARMGARVADMCADSTLVGSFSENHDMPRFAAHSKDLAMAKNVLAYTILADGIPIIYAGQEQHFTGGFDPANREAVWLSSYTTDSPLYRHIAALNQLRNHAIAVETIEKTRVLGAGNSFLVLRKGRVVTLLTNSRNKATRKVVGTGYGRGERVVDVLACVEALVGTGGVMKVVVEKGLPKVGMCFLRGREER